MKNPLNNPTGFHLFPAEKQYGRVLLLMKNIILILGILITCSLGMLMYTANGFVSCLISSIVCMVFTVAAAYAIGTIGKISEDLDEIKKKLK